MEKAFLFKTKIISYHNYIMLYISFTAFVIKSIIKVSMQIDIITSVSPSQLMYCAPNTIVNMTNNFILYNLSLYVLEKNMITIYKVYVQTIDG